MHEQTDSINEQDRRWYVMVHLKPNWIETMLHRENRGELTPVNQEPLTGNRLEPFEFFVPFLFMRPDAGDEVRNIFHNFV